MSCAKYYIGQPIELSTTWTDENGDIITLEGATIIYYYWLPGNDTEEPSGSVNGAVVFESAGTSSGTIPKTVNIAANKGTWRIQGRLTKGDDPYPEQTSRFTTYGFGA